MLVALRHTWITSRAQAAAMFVAVLALALVAPASSLAYTGSHPMKFTPGYDWWPPADLTHLETGPAAWPWDANVVNDTFRVMSFMDRDGNDRVYDARWAGAVNMWRDWNNNQGGMCIGGVDLQVRLHVPVPILSPI
jgi:hypothetical protein